MTDISEDPFAALLAQEELRNQDRIKALEILRYSGETLLVALRNNDAQHLWHHDSNVEREQWRSRLSEMVVYGESVDDANYALTNRRFLEEAVVVRLAMIRAVELSGTKLVGSDPQVAAQLTVDKKGLLAEITVSNLGLGWSRAVSEVLNVSLNPEDTQDNDLIAAKMWEHDQARNDWRTNEVDRVLATSSSQDAAQRHKNLILGAMIRMRLFRANDSVTARASYEGYLHELVCNGDLEHQQLVALIAILDQPERTEAE